MTFQSRVLASHWIAAREPAGKTMVVLHGRGDSHRGFLWLPEVLGCADLDYLLVDAPDDFFGGYSWYDLPPDQGPGVLRSRGLLDQLFQELHEAGRSASHTLVLGFSQGCLMALEWGTRTERELAGFVGISGYCYDMRAIASEATVAGRAARYLVTHGTADEVVPYAPTKEQISYLQGQGFNMEFHTFDKDHTIDPERELPLIRAFVKDALALA